MTTEEAILQLTSLKEYLDRNIPLSTADESIDRAIQALRAQQNGGWISVKDRLPEQTGEYLATYKIHNGPLKVGIAWFQSWEGEPIWNDSAFKRVTHWQPLPELPKKEEEA